MAEKVLKKLKKGSCKNLEERFQECSKKGGVALVTS